MARYDLQKQSMWAGMTLSTTVHGVAAALIIFGLPILIDRPVEIEEPISVAVITPDIAVGSMAPDRQRNIWPGDTAARTGEGLAAPQGDVEDAPANDAPAPARAALQSAPASALDGAPNDLEGSDALPPGETPGIAAVSASSGPVLGETASAEQPPGAPTPGEWAAPPPGDSMAGDSMAGDSMTGDSMTGDSMAGAVIVVAAMEGARDDGAEPAPWVPPKPGSLADISDYLSRGLERMREDIENGEVAPETRARQLQADAEQGDPESQYALAALYQLGLGVPRDPAQAIALYRSAAEKRFVDAQVRLGDMLATGAGAASAPVEAQAWWRIAAAAGEPLAVAGAALLGDELSPAENAEARTRAQRIEKLWKSWERWSSADSGGGLDERLLAAAGAGDADEVKRLIDTGANPNASDEAGRSALLHSVIAGHDDTARALLRRGAHVDSADADGKSALMWASDAGHMEIARLLLKRGADMEARDDYGQTALIDAAWRGHDKIVEILLGLDADANARSIDGVTALMWAAINGYPETARQLITAGAAVDAADKDRFTPLIRAAWNGHAEVVAVLIEAGADAGAKSRDGKTALRLAHGGGFKEIVALLRAAGAVR